MYKIIYDIDLEKALKKIPKCDVLAIVDRIEELAKDPRAIASIKLTGRDAYRLRVGNYRIIYRIQDKQLLIVIIDVDGRADIYKR